MSEIIERDGKAWVKCQCGDCEKPATHSIGTWVFCPQHIGDYSHGDGTIHHGAEFLLRWAMGQT
jgi:hypothetical protein